MNVLAGSSLVVGCVALYIAGWAWRLDSRSWLNRMVAASLVLYALRAAFTAVASTADLPGFEWAQRLVFLTALSLHPLGVAVVVAAVQLQGTWARVAVGATTLVAVAVAAIIVPGTELIDGFKTTPWGNVGLASSNPVGYRFLFLLTTVATVATLAVVVWKWRTTESRRYRSAIVVFVAVGALTNALAYLSFSVLWRQEGLPDFSVLARAPFLALYWVLIARYRFLHSGAPALDDALFHSLDEPLALVDPSGRFQEVSPRFAELVGKPQGTLRHRPVDEVLGWGPRDPIWEALIRHRPNPQSVTVTLGGAHHSLVLEPLVDRFGDLGGVLIRVQPQGDVTGALEGFGLTEREKQVGLHLVEGLSGPEIARVLGISPATVKNHLHSLFQKTATSNRVELVATLLPRANKP